MFQLSSPLVCLAKELFKAFDNDVVITFEVVDCW